MSSPVRALQSCCLCVVLLCGLPAAQAAERSAVPAGQTGWDSMVSSLLATGMYGFSSAAAPGLTVQLQHADADLMGVSPEAARLDAQAITFSYEGSSGLLEFSAGYILANQKNNRDEGAVFLGINPRIDADFDPSHSWYLALDLSRSYQVDDSITFSFGNRAMLLENPFDTREGHIFSLLFNMPISYKNYLTITPRFQWSRPLGDATSPLTGRQPTPLDRTSPQDVFYGGVSISFSY